MVTFLMIPKEATSKLLTDVLSTMYLRLSLEEISYVSSEKVDVFELLWGMIIPLILNLIVPFDEGLYEELNGLVIMIVIFENEQVADA